MAVLYDINGSIYLYGDINGSIYLYGDINGSKICWKKKKKSK